MFCWIVAACVCLSLCDYHRQVLWYVGIVYIVMAMAVGDDLNRMCFAGIVGMWDPPRKNVVTSIQTLTEGSVDVKMITGDSLDTAKAIGTAKG